MKLPYSTTTTMTSRSLPPLITNATAFLANSMNALNFVTGKRRQCSSFMRYQNPKYKI